MALVCCQQPDRVLCSTLIVTRPSLSAVPVMAHGAGTASPPANVRHGQDRRAINGGNRSKACQVIVVSNQLPRMDLVLLPLPRMDLVLMAKQTALPLPRLVPVLMAKAKQTARPHLLLPQLDQVLLAAQRMGRSHLMPPSINSKFSRGGISWH